MYTEIYKYNTLVNPQNYGPYVDITKPDCTHICINIQDITKENWRHHYNSVFNILKDGIYTDRVQGFYINVNYGDFDLDLYLIDYWFNLMMWRLLIEVNIPIRPKYVFFPENLKANEIKDYIDEFFINQTRGRIDTSDMNNIIADVLHCYHDVDIFADYICNTVNMEDTAELAIKDPGFYECLHTSFASYPMDEVKSAISKVSRKSIDYIKNAKNKLGGYDHCMAEEFRTEEGLNVKQYTETSIGIGPKPNGHGGLFPNIIDHAFMNGGVASPMEYYTESSTGRIAQIIKFNNVSTSGTFARILSLNNMDSRLRFDDKYDCHTTHLISIFVRNDIFLKHLNLLYYRESRNGIEKIVDWKKDKHLIGKTIYVRTPITCVSAALGHGICYKCYGGLAHTVFNKKKGIGINIGRIAAEIITSKLTQTQLSTKHILEAVINKITWCEEFSQFFDIEGNIISVTSEINYKDLKLLIDPDSIESDNEDLADMGEDDDMSAAMNMAEYITSFDVMRISTGEIFHISNDRDEKLFITQELNAIIRKKAEPVDGYVSIGFNELKEMPIFVMVLQNNEITKTLKMISNLYNKADHVRGKTIDQLFQEILDTNIEGRLGISAIHYAVLLMNQVRDADIISMPPNWTYDNTRYTILSLNEAINNNPSITISLSYQKIGKLFYAPLTYKKRGASFMDMFFMLRPQRVLRDIEEEEIVEEHKPGEIWEPIKFFDDPYAVTSKDDIDTDLDEYEEE